MTFTEYLIPTLILITVTYSTIAFYFFKRNKKNEANMNKVGDAVKKATLATNDKVDELTRNFDKSIAPSLKNLELEIKNINCHFSAELVLEKLKLNGYKKAKLLNDNKIITGVVTATEGARPEEELKVGHMITLELENSSILIESYSLTIEKPSSEVYEEILKENANLKVSDFGIQILNNVTFLIAQTYLVYPKESFHITPLIEALDHLEIAQITIRDKLKSIGSNYTNISLVDYAQQKIEHEKTMIESS
ncbi:hypothetical protein [Enterovibrio norvegicus]|uniref:hypothetical protein n=1 Tax=Enterovibrio norvegicus TaxID=188144 RepID=UPI000C835A2E|nr:hypothetical protein [Enterovibrio norvegicus]PMH59629.1 hypothetical protein BCU62_22290 [Enterovibrio norvegicus]